MAFEIVQAALAAEIARYADGRMLDQIAPDAGQRRDDADAMLGEFVRRADTAAHQHRGRVDRPAGEDEFAPCTISSCAPWRSRRRSRACPRTECDAQGLGADREVFPRAHRGRQIRHRAGYALVVLVDRGRDRHHAVFPFAVLVRHDRQAALAEHVRDDLDEAGPVLARIAADGDRAFLAVILAAEIQIAFELAEVGQHRSEIPARRAHLLPAVVIGRRAAIGDQPIDARSAAENARLFVARAPCGLPDRWSRRRRAAR